MAAGETLSDIRAQGQRWCACGKEPERERSMGVPMEVYKVGFFKNLVGGNGCSAKCLQQVIEIRHARTIERATRAAEYRYARRRGVRNWQLYADLWELEVDRAGRRGSSEARRS